MKLIWQQWWRSINGVVSHDKGFALKDAPDYFYFGVDPETQNEQISEDDAEHYRHVDDLFETREEAAAHAVKYLTAKIELYQRRLATASPTPTPVREGPMQGHNVPCCKCGKVCDCLAGNPGKWPMFLVPVWRDCEPGVVEVHCSGCVHEMVAATHAKWEDKPDEWTAAIRIAHPTLSGSHAEYAVAMQMVGNRHSKHELVALVNWLLVRQKMLKYRTP